MTILAFYLTGAVITGACLGADGNVIDELGRAVLSAVWLATGPLYAWEWCVERRNARVVEGLLREVRG